MKGERFNKKVDISCTIEEIVKPWPQTLSPKPKSKGPWADTKLLQATTTTTP